MYFDGLKDEYFPVFSSYKLMAAADLCISVNSMAAAEAVAAGVPSVNIYMPHLDFAEPLSDQDVRYYEELLDGRTNSLLNFPGCVWSVYHQHAAVQFASQKLSDYQLDRSAMTAYSSYFLGIEKQASSQRILEKVKSGGKPISPEWLA
jgi:hypothetical protein